MKICGEGCLKGNDMTWIQAFCRDAVAEPKADLHGTRQRLALPSLASGQEK